MEFFLLTLNCATFPAKTICLVYLPKQCVTLQLHPGTYLGLPIQNGGSLKVNLLFVLFVYILLKWSVIVIILNTCLNSICLCQHKFTGELYARYYNKTGYSLGGCTLVLRGYDKNSESDFFFPPPKSEYFFQKKNP